MANNRMFLIHKPSKLGVMLGKNMGCSWYKAPEKDTLESFYEYIASKAEMNQDDFVLAMEDCENSSCFNDWIYTDKKEAGFRVFEIIKLTL